MLVRDSRSNQITLRTRTTCHAARQNRPKAWCSSARGYLWAVITVICLSVLTVVSELAEYERTLRKTALRNLRRQLVVSWT